MMPITGPHPNNRRIRPTSGEPGFKALGQPEPSGDHVFQIKLPLVEGRKIAHPIGLARFFSDDSTQALLVYDGKTFQGAAPFLIDSETGLYLQDWGPTKKRFPFATHFFQEPDGSLIASGCFYSDVRPPYFYGDGRRSKEVVLTKYSPAGEARWRASFMDYGSYCDPCVGVIGSEVVAYHREPAGFSFYDMESGKLLRERPCDESSGRQMAVIGNEIALATSNGITFYDLDGDKTRSLDFPQPFERIHRLVADPTSDALILSADRRLLVCHAQSGTWSELIIPEIPKGLEFHDLQIDPNMGDLLIPHDLAKTGFFLTRFLKSADTAVTVIPTSIRATLEKPLISTDGRPSPSGITIFEKRKSAEPTHGTAREALEEIFSGQNYTVIGFGEQHTNKFWQSAPSTLEHYLTEIVPILLEKGFSVFPFEHFPVDIGAELEVYFQSGKVSEKRTPFLNVLFQNPFRYRDFLAVLRYFREIKVTQAPVVFEGLHAPVQETIAIINGHDSRIREERRQRIFGTGLTGVVTGISEQAADMAQKACGQGKKAAIYTGDDHCNLHPSNLLRPLSYSQMMLKRGFPSDQFAQITLVAPEHFPFTDATTRRHSGLARYAAEAPQEGVRLIRRQANQYTLVFARKSLAGSAERG